jgi:acyl dehydratase
MTPRGDFALGEQAVRICTVTREMIDAFAELSGDTNPVHLDEDYARGTRFGGTIAHGLLVVSLLSALLGTELPGPGAIYLGQDLRFRAPVKPGDTITARVTVTGWNPDNGRVNLATEAENQDGVTVLTGEARLVMSQYLD